MYIWKKKDWQNITINSEDILKPLSAVRQAQGRLLGKLSILNKVSIQQAREAVLVEEAVKTAEIEGMVLNRDSVRSSLARRLGGDVQNQLYDRNADGLVAVLLDATTNYKKVLNISRLHSWQAALFPTGYSGLNKISTGRLRGDIPMQIVSGPIGREKVHYVAPPRRHLDQEMKSFFAWWEKSAGKQDGILRAAEAHLKFVIIHPYEDGNGRIARALTEMALAQDENSDVRYYSMSDQIMRMKKSYYDILQAVTSCEADVAAWYLWFLSCLHMAIDNSQKIIAGVIIRAEFWQKNSQLNINLRQKKVINKMLEHEPFGFEGGLSTRKYVSIAGVSRATAFREMSELVQLGILQPMEGKGRNISYKLVL